MPAPRLGFLAFRKHQGRWPRRKYACYSTRYHCRRQALLRSSSRSRCSETRSCSGLARQLELRDWAQIGASACLDGVYVLLRTEPHTTDRLYCLPRMLIWCAHSTGDRPELDDLDPHRRQRCLSCDEQATG